MNKVLFSFCLKILIVALGICTNQVYAQEITIKYWENDSLKVKGALVNGERNGFWQEWYPNGHLKYEGNYLDGVFEGTWKFYCKHGYAEREVLWRNGKCYRIITYFLGNKPSLYLNFKEGLTSDEYLEYYDIFHWGRSNQLRVTMNRSENDSNVHYKFIPIFLNFNYLGRYDWRQNQPVKYLDSIIVIEKLRNEHLVEFCRSLNQEFEYIELYDSLREYRMVKRFDDGVVLDKRNTFYSMEPYGLYRTELYINDTIVNKVNYTYLYEEKQECVNYFEEDKIQSMGQFKEGKIEGVWQYFSREGKLIQKEKYKKGKRIKSEVYE